MEDNSIKSIAAKIANTLPLANTQKYQLRRSDLVEYIKTAFPAVKPLPSEEIIDELIRLRSKHH